MRFLLLIQLILLLSCSSVEKREALRADHDTDMNVPAIDDFIISLKKEYIERCYMPVLKRIPSNAPRPCENDLLQLLERRYSMDYTQEHVDMAADELFLSDIKDRLQKKIKTEPNLRNAVRKRFKNMDDIIGYYKPKYTFRKTEKNSG